MTPSPAPSLRIALPLAADSDRLGQALARGIVDLHADGFPPDGFTLHFSGTLGAGKTTIVRALLRGLGVEGRIKSPTYTLVEPYAVEVQKSVESRQHVKLHCYHFDFYRFEDPHEWLDAGFRDYFSDAALRLVEWPERALANGGSLLPRPDVAVRLATDGDGRTAHLEAGTGRGATWLTRVDLADRSPPRAGG